MRIVAGIISQPAMVAAQENTQAWPWRLRHMPEHVLSSRMKIITDGGGRRRWLATQKPRMVGETLQDGPGIPVIAERNRVARLFRESRLRTDTAGP